MKSRETIVKIAAVAVLLVFALVSFFALAGKYTDPAAYAGTIQSIDDKKAAVLALTATSATASTAIAAIPGDASTPIANQIMEISEYLFIVVCFLVMEKSLLTVLGFAAFKVLIPLGCVICAVFLFTRMPQVSGLGLKLIALGLVLVSIIPFSMGLGNMIYEVNSADVEALQEEVNGVQEEEPEEEEEKNWFGQIIDKVDETVENTTEGAKDLLNRFIDAIALFIITYCAIPVIVVFAAFGFVKTLFQIPLPVPGLPPRHGRHPGPRKEEEAAV